MAETYPPPVEQDGDDTIINVHEDGALALFPITIANELGQIEDASAYTLMFRSKATNFAKALVANPADARGRALSLTKAECAGLADGARWAIFDETSGEPVDLAKGVLRKYR